MVGDFDKPRDTIVCQRVLQVIPGQVGRTLRHFFFNLFFKIYTKNEKKE